MLHWIRHYNYNAPHPKKTNLCIPPLLLIPINVFILCLWQVLSLLLAVSRFLRGPQVCEKRYCLYVWRHLISSSPPWPLSQRSKTLPRESQQTIHNCEVTRTQTCTELNTRGRWKVTFNNRKHNGQKVWQQRQREAKEMKNEGTTNGWESVFVTWPSVSPEWPGLDKGWNFSRINRFS